MTSPDLSAGTSTPVEEASGNQGVGSRPTVQTGLNTAAVNDNGGGGIRTPGTLAGPTVFKTVPIGHSGTPPMDHER